MVAEFLAYQAGVATGFHIFSKLTPEQRAEINKLIDEE